MLAEFTYGFKHMDSHIDGVISDLQVKLAEQEAEVKKSKQLINLLCTQYGRQPLYPDAELQSSSAASHFAPDEFYGQPLAGSIKKILDQRKARGLGPATPREIYDVLVDGGYAFETDNEQNRLTGLRISLRKSSNTFHRLPDGKRYGLLEWYPKAKRRSKNDGDDDAELESSLHEQEADPEEISENSTNKEED